MTIEHFKTIAERFEQSCKDSYFEKKTKDLANEIAKDYGLEDILVNFEDEDDFNRVIRIMRHCLWVGWCAGVDSQHQQ